MEFLSLMDVVGDDPTSLNRAILNDIWNGYDVRAMFEQYNQIELFSELFAMQAN